MSYAIARKYNPNSEVFVTLTHYWAWTSHPRFYPSKDLMEMLIQYSKAEGDFEWAMAHHPYPESLMEPKTWLDKKVDFTFNSPLITFANLEVLNAWIKLPEVLYKGKTKRTLWLSENGTNSRTYSEGHLKEQAAGFAYTWKKMKVLDGIDGIQWHNWFDNRGEGGLRIGLRHFPDDELERNLFGMCLKLPILKMKMLFSIHTKKRSGLRIGARFSTKAKLLAGSINN